MENNLNSNFNFSTFVANEIGYKTGSESDTDIFGINIKTNTKTAYGQVLVQLIYDEMEDVFSAIKQNFEANLDSLPKANINAAYRRLNKLITDLKTDSCIAFQTAAEEATVRPKELLLYQTIPEQQKKSFLVFKKNKYSTICVDQIAFIYIKNNSSYIMTLQEQEYPLDQSLDQIQNSLSSKSFFRLNRQYLVNFNAIKEVEPYFARKLFVRLLIPSPDQLLIGKERTTSFLNWMEHR